MPSSLLYLWPLGLLLEAGLLVLLFRRGLARRFPVFVALIAFYIARGVALFVLFGHLSKAVYGELYDSLAFVDLCLQVLFAAEILYRALSDGRSVSTLRAALTAVSLVTMTTALIAVANALPPSPFTPVDRGAASIAVVMIGLVLWMVIRCISGAPRVLVLGLAGFQVISVSAEFVRRYATLHRSTSLWVAASWAESGVWLVIVAFWLLTIATSRAIANREWA